MSVCAAGHRWVNHTRYTQPNLMLRARHVDGDELLEVVFSQRALDAILQRVIVGDDIPDICGRMEGLGGAGRDAMVVRTVQDVVDFARR